MHRLLEEHLFIFCLLCVVFSFTRRVYFDPVVIGRLADALESTLDICDNKSIDFEQHFILHDIKWNYRTQIHQYNAFPGMSISGKSNKKPIFLNSLLYAKLQVLISDILIVCVAAIHISNDVDP